MLERSLCFGSLEQPSQAFSILNRFLSPDGSPPSPFQIFPSRSIPTYCNTDVWKSWKPRKSIRSSPLENRVSNDAGLEFKSLNPNPNINPAFPLGPSTAPLCRGPLEPLYRSLSYWVKITRMKVYFPFWTKFPLLDKSPKPLSNAVKIASFPSCDPLLTRAHDYRYKT